MREGGTDLDGRDGELGSERGVSEMADSPKSAVEEAAESDQEAGWIHSGFS